MAKNDGGADELRHKDTWTGTHRGVKFEVCRWATTDLNYDGHHKPGHDIWNYYIFLPEPMVREEDQPSVFLELGELDKYGHRNYDYMSGPLAELEWHCGITYYEILPMSFGPRCVKAGCDYNHLWDEEIGYPFALAGVAGEARETIDSLHSRLKLRWRDSWYGKWYDTEAEAAGWAEAGRAAYAADLAARDAGEVDHAEAE